MKASGSVYQGMMDSEDTLSASRKAWLSAVERFNKILQEDLENAKANSRSPEYVMDAQMTQLKLLAIWKKAVGRIPKALLQPGKEHWIQRKSTEPPQEHTVD